MELLYFQDVSPKVCIGVLWWHTNVHQISGRACSKMKWVLQNLRKHALFTNLKKCSFGQAQVDYMGQIISSSGVKHKCYKELGYTNICEGTENFKTIKRIQRLSHSLNWRKTFKNVSGNALCQTHKYSTLSPTGLLQPIPLPNQILFGLYGYHWRSSKIRKSECNLRDKNMLS